MTPLRRRNLARLLLAGAALLAVALLVDPHSRFYPPCPIHYLFGIDCPGCGATRALTALLRGRLAEALRLNAFFVLLLPAALALAVESYRRAVRPGRFCWPQPPTPALYATVAAAAIFTIARNIIR